MVVVSVVMPAYNAAETIDRSIDSALAQSFGDLELIVVDDASSDATADVVRRRMAGDARIRLLRMPKNGGPSAARNAALEAATGEWIALLDADDTWRADRLETLLRESDCDFVADQIIAYDDAAGVETGLYLRRAYVGDLDLERMLRLASGYDLGFLQPIMRRAFLQKAGIRYPTDLRYGEDLLFYVRCLAERARFRVLSYAGYVYRTPLGRQSSAVSPHSHTRADKSAIAAALEAVAVQYGGRLTASERDAFAWRAEFYRTRIAFDAFLAACRRRDAAGALAGFVAAPVSVCRHLFREVWARVAGSTK